jgi:hypothetical protein
MQARCPPHPIQLVSTVFRLDHATVLPALFKAQEPDVRVVVNIGEEARLCWSYEQSYVKVRLCEIVSPCVRVRERAPDEKGVQAVHVLFHTQPIIISDNKITVSNVTELFITPKTFIIPSLDKTQDGGKMKPALIRYLVRWYTINVMFC